MAAIQLPKISLSPSTLQYHIPASQRPKPTYIPRFSLNAEQYRKTLGQAWLRTTDPLMPAYPYGRNNHFRESNNGLYGGATIQSGNKISKGRNEGKTLRKWFPNVRLETVRSEALDQTLHIPITARVMRTISKCGGLDQYLLGEKPARIKELGLLGWKLRWHVLQALSGRNEHKVERARLGLPETSPLNQDFADVWQDYDRRTELLEEQETAWMKLRAKAERFDSLVRKTWSSADNTKYYPKTLVTLMKRNPKTLAIDQDVEIAEMTKTAQKLALVEETKAEEEAARAAAQGLRQAKQREEQMKKMLSQLRSSLSASASQKAPGQTSVSDLVQ